MAVQTPPYALQASSHSAELFRRALGSLVVATGVVQKPDLRVTQNTGTDLKCQVAAGQIWIPGTYGSSNGMPTNPSRQSNYTPTSATFMSQGAYYGYNDASITALTFSPANVTNPRIDLVVATVQDAGYSGGTNNWVIQVVTGTAAGSPVVPAIPNSSVVLASVAVAANATAITNANITDQRPFVAAGFTASNIVSQTIQTLEGVTSGSASDMATVGPTVSVLVPASGVVMVSLSADIDTTSGPQYAFMYFVSSGATTFGATQERAIYAGNFVGTSSSVVKFGCSFLLTGMNPGITTFTAKYAQAFGGTAYFQTRTLIAQVFP